jgi:hypothetical protein
MISQGYQGLVAEPGGGAGRNGNVFPPAEDEGVICD